MSRLIRARSTALAISLFGALANLALTLNVLAAARNIRWEPDSEWEGRVDGVRLVWGLLFAKFAVASAVCSIGFVGTLKNNPTLVRVYRDYSIADFSFTVALLPAALYAAALRRDVRAAACEALARQPEVLRDLLELGLTLENCEPWLERAVLGGSAALVIIMVARLHLLLAVSRYYAALTARSPLPIHSPQGSAALRVYVLPPHHSAPAGPVVYAPIPLDSLPVSARDHVTEAWLTSSPHRRHHRHSSSTGRIALPIHIDEALFPSTKC